MPKNLPLADIYKERNHMGIVVLIGSVLALIGAFVFMAFLLIKEISFSLPTPSPFRNNKNANRKMPNVK